MRRTTLISCLILISLSALSQKVTVQVMKLDQRTKAGWEILDEHYNLIYSGEQLMTQDTVSLSLRSDARYIFKISVNDVYEADIKLWSLGINGEPIILVTSGIGTGDHFYPFFTGVRIPQTKITGGTNALISDFPWQVYLIAGNFQCGGSIISDTWVVTAAHCVLNTNGSAIPASSMSVKVGATSPQLSSDGKTYQVNSVIVNPAYNSQTHENDVALLRIAGPINFTNATPIRLVSPYDISQGAIDPGVMSWVTGFGLISVTPQVFPTTLQKVQLPIVSNAQASTVWGPIPATDLMAGFLNGNKDACSGDSGGPLVVPVFNGFKLAGIVSWGSTNCNTYGAYSSIAALGSWIRTNSGIPLEFTPPSPVGDTIICQGTLSTLYSIPNQTGASAYEWQISPANAGSVTGNSNLGTVTWNKSYTGNMTIFVRVTINNVVSGWAWLKTRSVVNTTIYRQSRDTTLCAGKPVILSVDATGDNLSYSWTRDGTAVTSSLPGLIVFQSPVSSNSGGYICKITGTCGTQYSRTINLTVHPVTKITQFSPKTEVSFGSDVTMTVAADGFALSYQWEKDNKQISNSNSPQLFLTNVNATDIGLYRNIVTGSCGSDRSDSIYLYVKKSDFKNDPEIFLWPSIANQNVTVALSNNEIYNIRIFSSGGVLVKEITGCRYQTTIDVSFLARGSYLVNVYNSNFRRSVKMIKR